MVKGFVFLRLCVFALIFFSVSNAQTLAPGAPGKDAQWATAGKQAVGTSATLESKVWFTLAQGVMTEVYYPDVTVANVHLLQFVVVNAKTGKVETEQEDAMHEIKVEPIYVNKNLSPIESLNVSKVFESQSSLSFTQISRSKTKSRNGANLNGLIIGGDGSAWTLIKKYVTNPKNNSVVISVKFNSTNPNDKLYIYYDPSLGNSGMGDTGWSQGNALLSSDKDKSSALTCRNCKFEEATSSFFGTSGDGLEQLKKEGKITNVFSRAEKGNVVQTAKITPVFSKGYDFEIALGFGKTTEEALKNSQDSLVKGFAKNQQEYQAGWIDYLKNLPRVEPKYQAQLNMAAMQLKIHEDKTVRGANIASLSVPWGGGDNANVNNIGGYHLVWSRDLYQVATAFMALGDKDAAIRALNFLFKVQQREDGSFPQNSYLDGKPFWGSLQMDEVAYPLILAHELGASDKETYEKHVKKAADFIVKNGPKTPQERWEEEGGFSPSTIAAEIAGLVCAAEIARKNGDGASATIYLATADEWARKVEMWTATTNGKYGDGNYYLRITGNGKPDAGEKIELNNGAGFFDEREIVDAGFLELVRLGIKPADDPLIAKSVKVIDEVIRVQTPNGDAFYRYNNDGYGEMDDGRRWNWDGKYTGKGRLWALLSGERGQYELAMHALGREKFGDKPLPRGYTKWELILRSAERRLDAMLGFANEGLMIPEQIWDKPVAPKVDKQFVPELKFGEGTGSATPLGWSMAQFIRLAVNLQAGKNLDTPEVVYNRYVKNGIPGQTSGFGGMDADIVLPVNAGEKFSMTRRAAPNSKVVLWFKGEKRLVPVNEKGELTLEIITPDAEEIAVVAVETPDGSTAFERVRVRAANTKKTGQGNFSFTPPRDGEASPKIFGAKRASESDVMFVYRGAAKTVEIAGDFTDWQPRGHKFQDFGDYKVLILPFSNAARFEYKLIVDGKWIADPLNPNKLDNGVGSENSFYAMPDYKPTAWNNAEGMTKAGIVVERISSEIYGEREVKVYVPEGFSNQPLPVVYFQDGSEYMKKADAVTIQRNLVKAGKIKPFIMVFLDPKDRMKEYWANDDYARFVATEVVPAIDARFKTIKSRDGRGIIGASLGGITSVHVALKYPNVFSRVGGQSSSFWVDNERIIRELSKIDAERNAFKFYFDDGIFEGAEDSRRVNILLRGKGFPVTYVEGVAGHNWTAWRDRLADAFVAFMN